MSKNDLLDVLKGKSKAVAKKAYSVRLPLDKFAEIEKINTESGLDSINEVINILIEIGLREYEKSKS